MCYRSFPVWEEKLDFLTAVFLCDNLSLKWSECLVLVVLAPRKPQLDIFDRTIDGTHFSKFLKAKIS